MKSLSNYRLHQALAIIFIASTSLLTIFAISGCSGTFLSEAPSVIEAVLAAISSVSGILTLLVPGASQVFAVLNAVTGEITEIQTLISQYQTTPSETTLQKIEAAIQLAITNIQPILAPAGVPAATATKVGAVAQLILGQLEAWLSLFPALAPVSAAPVITANIAGQRHVTSVVKKPMSAKDFKKAVNDILEAPTGDPATDAAFAKAKKL